jgi:hypothetical protein
MFIALLDKYKEVLSNSKVTGNQLSLVGDMHQLVVTFTQFLSGMGVTIPWPRG